MPRRDGNGPTGMGPGSGRGAGWCRGRGFGLSGYTGAGPVRRNDLDLNRAPDTIGRGQGGYGRGWRNMFRATGLPGWLRNNDDSGVEQGLALVEEEGRLTTKLEALQAELESIRQRLSEMERGPKE